MRKKDLVVEVEDAHIPPVKVCVVVTVIKLRGKIDKVSETGLL
jgi:hypothetical protein